MSTYMRRAAGIVGCAVAATTVGFAASMLLAHASDVMRLVVISTAAMTTFFVLLAHWQNLGPRTIGSALRG